MDQFSYYMIRIRHAVEDRTDALAGVVERLGSGQKQSFAGGEELLRLLGRWIDGHANMPPVIRGGKTSGDDRTSGDGEPSFPETPAHPQQGDT